MARLYGLCLDSEEEEVKVTWSRKLKTLANIFLIIKSNQNETTVSIRFRASSSFVNLVLVSQKVTLRGHWSLKNHQSVTQKTHLPTSCL